MIPEDYLLDRAIQLLHQYLPEDFINMIDDDLHNDLVCALESYVEYKEGIKI